MMFSLCVTSVLVVVVKSWTPDSDFAVRRPILKIGERAFSVVEPRLWNQLPTELKLCQSTALFKHKLKTFLFTVSYGVSENNI